MDRGRDKIRRFDLLSAGLTVALHAIVILLLWFAVIKTPRALEESGVPVVMGISGGTPTEYEYTQVEHIQSVVPAAPSVPTPEIAEPVITQETEETITIPSAKPQETQSQKSREEIEAEKRLAEEKRAADEASRLMSNLFSNQTSEQTQYANSDTGNAEGAAGSPDSDATEGKISGNSGFGTWDLNGRSIDGNGLQRPVYVAQEEGRVVVTITVNPQGDVIATSINKRSNTTNAQLRAAAEDAARRTKFNAVGGLNNQTGTITYYFKLK